MAFFRTKSDKRCFGPVYPNLLSFPTWYHYSPDNLAATASSSLVWMILELVVIYFVLTVMSINTSLTKWDILSFSCYKYVGMIVVLLIGLCLNSSLAYYISLAYVSAALVFFLLRTLKLRIEPEVNLHRTKLNNTTPIIE